MATMQWVHLSSSPLMLLLILSVGGTRATLCPDGTAGLTKELYAASLVANSSDTYAHVTCIPEDEFNAFSGDVILNGLQHLTSIETKAFYGFKGKLVVKGEYRTLHGLVPGQLYGITFLAAYRPGHGAAVLSLSVDDAPLSGSDKIALTASFEQYESVFNATSTNATIGFSNVGTAPGDRAAFVDAVRVTAWTTDPSTGENYWLNTVKLDWVAAEDRCQAAGASLVKLASKEESDFVMTTVASRSSPWIGYNDRAKEGAFVWTDGTSCTRYDANTPSSWCNFFSWCSGEPNNSGGEDCVHVANVYHWNDASCSDARASICQYKWTKAAAAPTCITSTTTTTTTTTTTGTTTTACWDPNYAGTGPCTSTTTTKTTTTTLHAFELRAWTLSSDGSHYTTLDGGTGGGRYLYNVSGNSYSKYLMQGLD